MSYQVKEIFYTLQGEGAQTGRAAVFCRFAGCNLWSGREVDRANAICKFCDTDFIGVDGNGGEPLLQLDSALIDALHAVGFEIAVETNGTVSAPAGIDWICVSPKAGAPLVQTTGSELKLVYPQPDAMPEKFAAFGFRNFFLQPMDGPAREQNTQLALRYCMQHPQWRLSLQTHKLLGIPYFFVGRTPTPRSDATTRVTGRPTTLS
jgi:organic radical activating enzyme